MTKLKTIVVVATVLAASAIVGRLVSRQAAVTYGTHIRKAYSSLGLAGFSDPDMRRDLFADPELVNCANRIHNLSFLGGNYAERISEFKIGIVYLSDQVSIPEQQRFSNPPTLRYLPVDTTCKSYLGLTKAVEALTLGYNAQLWDVLGEWGK
jgi:hypothetical protein